MALHTHGFAHICPCTHVSLHTCPLRAILTRMPLHVCLCDTEGLTNSCSCTRMSPPPHTRVSSYTHTRVLAHACNSPGEKRTTESCSFPSDPPASGCCVSVSNTTHLWGTHTTGGGLGGPMGYGGRWGSYGLWGDMGGTACPSVTPPPPHPPPHHSPPGQQPHHHHLPPRVEISAQPGVLCVCGEDGGKEGGGGACS